MHKTFQAAAAALALTLVAGPALADDSTAALTNSGLVLTKNAAVEMKSENLYISDKAVRVKYVFLNTSPKDVNVTVAFPVPDLVSDGPDNSIAIPDYNSPNFLDFHITVDGKPVSALIEQQAIKNGVNQTAYLKSLGVPISPFYDATPIALAKLPLAQQNTLIQQGLAMLMSDPSDPGPRQLIGTWTLKTMFYWSQTFPAGQPVTIEHTYAPSVASTAVLVSSESDLKQYCVDADFMASLRKLTPPGEGSVPTGNPEFIHFVLVSGANWAAPIRDFQMTIDKGQPNALVSFCGTGVKKTSATTFAVHYTNYTPTADVAVLLLEPRPPN